MTRFQTVCTVFLLMVLGVGCGHHRDNPLDPQSPFYQAEGDTVISPGLVLRKVAKVVGGADESLVFDSNSDDVFTFTVRGDVPPVQAGDVLVHGQAPYFLKKVVRVLTQDDKAVVVETENAALTDVITNATIESSFSSKSATGQPHPKVVQAVKKLQLTLDGTPIDANGQATLTPTGQISLDPTYTVSLRIRDRKIDYFKIAVQAELDVDLDMVLESKGKSVSNARPSLGFVSDAPNHIVFLLGYIPVVIGIQGEFGVGATIQSDEAGTVSTGIKLKRTVVLGVEYRDGAWLTPTYSGAGTLFFVEDPDLQVTGSAIVDGYVTGQMNLKLYDVAGPYVGFRPYVGVSCDINPTQSQWKTTTGLRGLVGMQPEILDQGLKDREWNVLLLTGPEKGNTVTLVSKYLISGRVTENGVGLADVTVTLGGAIDKEVITDATGNYKFENLVAGEYRVTSSKTGYGFSEGQQTIAVTDADIGNVNFSAVQTRTNIISGQILANGQGVVDVAVTLLERSQTVHTDASGRFSFDGLLDGTYHVDVKKTGYAFAPTSAEVVINGTDINQDFIATVLTYAISGKITDSNGGLTGVLVELKGGVEGTTTTDVTGEFFFPGVPSGVYTLTPSRADYAFVPASRAVTVSGFGVDSQNFFGVRQTLPSTNVQTGETATVILPGNIQMDLVYVGSGTFLMGSPSGETGRYNDEGPQHQVQITKGFYMGKYEVTQKQWQAVMGRNPSVYVGANKPVESISWYDANEFIHRLNVAVGDSLYRLPTEAEWEFACRAGTTSRWSFGEDESQLVNYAWYGGNNSFDGTKDVGTRLPNQWNIYDMHGNVWEWVQDWYGAYTASTQTDPKGPATGAFRTFRGGNFNLQSRLVRSAIRPYTTPPDNSSDIGFRVLRRIK